MIINNNKDYQEAISRYDELEKAGGIYLKGKMLTEFTDLKAEISVYERDNEIGDSEEEDYEGHNPQSDRRINKQPFESYD